MEKFMRLIFLCIALFVVVMSSQAFAAATVFFKDGSKEVGDSVWIEGNSIYLNKSREVYEFSPGEISMEETLKYNRIGKYADITVTDSNAKDYQEKLRNPKMVSPKMKAKVKSATVLAAETTDSLPNDTEWWSPGDTPTDFSYGSPTLQNELLVIYAKYNQAASSGDFYQVVKYMPRQQAQRSIETLEKVSDKKTRLLRKKTLQEMAVKDFTAQKCAVSPDGTIAALSGKGKAMKGNKFQDAKGTIKFVKESDGWKVAFQIW